MPNIPVELHLLAWSVVLLLVQVFIQAQAANTEKGMVWSVGPRDGADPVPQGMFAGRARRALDNFKETYPAFVGLVLLLAALGRTGGLAEAGAILWLTARIAYLPAYLLGIPNLRTLLWFASIGGLGLMLAQAF